MCLLVNYSLDKTKISYENTKLNPKYRFNTFIVGSSNKVAYAAALAVAEAPGEVYNPLYLYGGTGCGKTHLMHSIGHYLLERNPDCKVLYVTGEMFTNEVIRTIRNENVTTMFQLCEGFTKADVLIYLVLLVNRLLFLRISHRKNWGFMIMGSILFW